MTVSRRLCLASALVVACVYPLTPGALPLARADGEEGDDDDDGEEGDEGESRAGGPASCAFGGLCGGRPHTPASALPCTDDDGEEGEEGDEDDEEENDDDEEEEEEDL